MALDYEGLLRDLRQESDWLHECLRALPADAWETPTPAVGWAIRDQVSHLAFFDDCAHLALTNADRFRIQAARLMQRGTDFAALVAEDYRHLSPMKLLDWFSISRHRLMDSFAADNAKRRLPWFGPDMSVASSATARLMETWAHGQDIYDTFDLPHPISSGLCSIAHLGVSTFGFVHQINGLDLPTEQVRVELQAPDRNEIWSWGPEDAMNRVSGPAVDFVLAVTQRRHVTDTALRIDGDVATTWMRIAQAFAGPPGPGRPSLSDQLAQGVGLGGSLHAASTETPETVAGA